MDEREELSLIASSLNDDELAIVVSFARRIMAGREHYGPLELSDDPRDMMREACEEALDLSAYMAMQLRRLEGQ